MVMEDYAIILDYLPYGKAEDERPIYQKEPIAYAVGEKYFTLMELVPKKGVKLSAHERVSIGKDRKDQIEYIKRRISYGDLNAAAKSELPYVIEELVGQNEERFLKFFNESQAVSTRLHQLELLPGIGKKLMWEILKERKKRPFESFEDLSQRIKPISDPKKLITRRILIELDEESRRVGKGKYTLFTAPPTIPRR
jgi:putative nucleotide binding protein